MYNLYEMRVRTSENDGCSYTVETQRNHTFGPVYCGPGHGIIDGLGNLHDECQSFMCIEDGEHALHVTTKAPDESDDACRFTFLDRDDGTFTSGVESETHIFHTVNGLVSSVACG